MSDDTKPAFDDLLLDQALDHILNSPEEEFSAYARELGLNPEQMAALNSAAARMAIDAHHRKDALVTGIDRSAVRVRPSTMLNQSVDNRSYLEKFVENAKEMGFKYTQEFLDNLSENSIRQRMAFKAKSTRHGKARRKSGS